MKSIRIILIIVISALLGYYVGVNKISYDWRTYVPNIQVTSKEPPPSVQSLDFTPFWTVMQHLETDYYDKTAIDPQKMLNGAITGMVESVNDPFTLYLPPVENTDFKQGLAGKFEGIGAELGMQGKQIIIMSPLDDSPSEKAGVRAGDEVLKVDGASTSGWSLQQAVDKIRGPKGTVVTLTVLHHGAASPKDIPITRNTITVKSVTSWVKPVKDIPMINIKNIPGDTNTNIAYIRLSQFGDDTNTEWLAATNQVNREMQQGKQIKGVILDLRNNPGGYLTDAVFIASEFIKSGTVVQQDDGKNPPVPLTVSRQGLLTNTPLVVLINGGSASASEIVAGALRDHGRAKLIGEKSFGKGTIQQAEDLGDNAGLHVTIARWLTPNGTWVGNGKNGQGLTPDITVALDPKNPTHDTQLEKAVATLINQ